MARKPRIGRAGYARHIAQCGNNRCACFVGEDDYVAYAHWLAQGAKKYDIAIHAWVMMTNHTHFLLTTSFENTVSLMMSYLGRHYARLLNMFIAGLALCGKVDTNRAWPIVIGLSWPAIAILKTTLLKRIWFHYLESIAGQAIMPTREALIPR